HASAASAGADLRNDELARPPAAADPTNDVARSPAAADPEDHDDGQRDDADAIGSVQPDGAIDAARRELSSDFGIRLGRPWLGSRTAVLRSQVERPSSRVGRTPLARPAAN